VFLLSRRGSRTKFIETVRDKQDPVDYSLIAVAIFFEIFTNLEAIQNEFSGNKT
jgi:hypothetical protein